MTTTKPSRIAIENILQPRKTCNVDAAKFGAPDRGETLIT